MKHARHLLFIALAAAPLALVCGAATANPVFPDLPSADMQLSWQDFKQLLDRVQAAEREQAEQKEQPRSPVPWVVAEAVYEADAVSGESALIRGTFRIHVWSDRWVQAPLFGLDVGIESSLLNGQPAPLVRMDDGYVLLLDQPGEHTVEVVFSVRTRHEDGTVHLAFDGPEATLSHMKLRIGAVNARVSAPKATRITLSPGEDVLEADIVFRHGRDLAVEWVLPAAQKEEPPEAVVAPRFTVLGSILATATESHLACDTLLQLDVLRGKINHFELLLPAAVHLLKVEGNGATWQTEREGDTQRITVLLNFDATGNYPLRLEYEMPVTPDAATLTLASVRAPGAARHSGYVAVTSQGNVEVDDAPESEHLRRVDTSDLPVELTARSARPVLHAFRYSDEDYLLALNYRRLHDVPVRVAGIDRARILSVVTEEGLIITHAAYLVRNNLKQFLELDIGKEAEVWAAQVNNKPVRPARNESITSDVVLMPLIKSQEGGVDRGAFPVELIYMRRMEPLTETWNQFDMEAPKTDILANLVEWEVLIPERYRVMDARGDLQRVARLTPWRAAAAKPSDAYSIKGRSVVIGEGEPRETLYRLREGIERFFIMDINNPAAQVAAPGLPQKDGQQRTSLPDIPTAPSVATTVAGVLPIQFSMPQTGRPLFFERVVTPRDTPLRLSIEAYRFSRKRELLAVLTGGALLLGLCLGAALRAMLLAQRRFFVLLIAAAALWLAIAAGVWWVEATPTLLVRGIAWTIPVGLIGPTLLRHARRLVKGLSHA